MGLIDRDYYSDAVLDSVPKGVIVLPLHEIESVLCDKNVVTGVAEQLGKDPAQIWMTFLDRVRGEFSNQTLNSVVARRVRSRVGDLLDGAFNGTQIVADLAQTGVNHGNSLSDLPAKTTTMFSEESKRVTDALSGDGEELLVIFPGKHLLSLLASVLGLKNPAELTSLVVKSLSRGHLNKDNPLFALGSKVETALLAYLPPRRMEPATLEAGTLGSDAT